MRRPARDPLAPSRRVVEIATAKTLRVPQLARIADALGLDSLRAQVSCSLLAAALAGELRTYEFTPEMRRRVLAHCRRDYPRHVEHIRKIVDHVERTT